MRDGQVINILLIVIGLIVFVVAALVAYEAHLCVQEYGGTIAEIGRAIDPELQDDYEHCVNRRFWGGVGAFVGALIAFAGATRV